MPFAARMLLLFGLVIATVGAAAPRPEPLAVLLARMRARSGPVWSAHLHSVSQLIEGSRAVDLNSQSQGVRVASYQCAGRLCDGTYFDGERTLSIDINGTALPDVNGADPYLRAERTVASLTFLTPDFTAQGGRIFDDGITLISGAPYRTLLVASGDAVPMLVYVDPKTATVRYLRDINGDETFEYRDYAAVGQRFWLPYEVLRNGQLLEHYRSRDVAAGPFSPPHGPAATFANGPVAVATDPEQTIPVFACTIDGIAARCLLDSGNSGLSLSLSLAERLDLPTLGSFRVRGLGDYATEVVRAGPLQIGGMTFAPADYVVLHDIDRFGYDVVLGADMFAATTIQLDQAQHRVVFGAPLPPGGISVPLEFEDFVPVLDVHLGALPAQLALDTGDESSINLDYDFYQAHHDLFSATSERAVSGVGGSSVELLGTIAHVQIGDLSITSPAIGTTRVLQGTAYGHVGSGLLSRYDVTIDYAAGELHFVAPAPTPSPRPTP
ncbi:MAG TPA: aspartyl protease family protein [Candidatus Lustribacter sp.]